MASEITPQSAPLSLSSGGTHLTPSPPTSPLIAVSRPPRTWPAALMALVALGLLLWAGSSYDPRRSILWTFTPLSSKSFLGGGWLVPAPGLGAFWIASALLGAALSVLAYRGLVDRYGSRGRARIIIPCLILAAGLEIRMLVLRHWHPLPLDAVTLGRAAFVPLSLWRWPLLLPDMVTLGLVLLALLRTGRSLWLAALYAFHPVALLALANGSAMFWLLPPMVLIAALEFRLRPWARGALAVIVSMIAVAWLMLTSRAALAHPFNGLMPTLLIRLGLDDPRRLVPALLVGESLLQFFIVVQAQKHHWPLARTWIHALVAWALFTPGFMPAQILPIVALIPLAWSPAGWMLSFVSLGAYAVTLTWHRDQPLALPFWLVLVTVLPVLIVEIEGLLFHAASTAADGAREETPSPLPA